MSAVKCIFMTWFAHDAGSLTLEVPLSSDVDVDSYPNYNITWYIVGVCKYGTF